MATYDLPAEHGRWADDFAAGGLSYFGAIVTETALYTCRSHKQNFWGGTTFGRVGLPTRPAM
jgi:hypothetical protein